MKWILENLFTLIIIASVIAQMVKAVRKNKGGDDEAGEAAPPKEYEFEDPELSERTRRIREEIQRKIAERQRGGAPEPVAAEPDDVGADEGPRDEPPVFTRPAPVAAPEPALATAGAGAWDSRRSAEILEQQAALAERLREAELMKAAAIRRAAFETETSDKGAAVRRESRGAILQDLRDPQALRRAFIMREILGPPAALR